MKILALRLRVFLSACCLISVITGSTVFGQQTVAAGPQPSVDELARKAEEFLSQWDKKGMPGCGVGTVLDGKLVYKRGFGMANLDYDIPNTPTTLFNIASASKPFTAFSIALLAQQGKLSFDDDIRKYLPEMPNYGEAITIRHLLTHTSGIRDYQALVFFGGLNTDGSLSDKAVLNILTRQKNISFRPGEKYQYSNSGYHLLGIIVGRVSGKSLRAFADENIFKPLGMKNTFYFDNRQEIVKYRASGYIVGPANRIRARASLFDLVGGGGILTTVEDLYLWDQNFYEPKVGNKELVKLMTTAGTLNSGENTGYGFGLFHNKYKGLAVIKHSGNMSGYRAQIVSFPEQKFSVIALCNNSAIFPSAIAEKLAEIYLEGQFPAAASAAKKAAEPLPPAITITEKDALRYAGTFVNMESGRVFKLGLKDGKLTFTGLTRGEVPVTPVSETRLLLVDGANVTELNPVFDKSGTISEVRILTKSGKPDVFVTVKPADNSLERLSEYAGTYYSEELDANYRISLKGSSLTLQIGENLEAPLTPWYPDFFNAAGGQLKFSFTRDDKGKIVGFVFNSDVDEREVKGVAFKRR